MSQEFDLQEPPESELEKVNAYEFIRNELQSIPDVQKLTLERARELSLRLHAGMNPETKELTPDAIDARDEMMFSCKRMVVFLAVANSSPGLDLMDLVQEGFIGAQKAAEIYNPDLGKFSTYAFRPIYWAIKHAVWNESNAERGLTFSDVLGEDGEVDTEFESSIIDTNSPYRGEIEERILFEEALGTLSPNRKSVIVGYYFDGLNLEQIASRMGICRERVSQIKEAALKQLWKCSGINPQIIGKLEL